MSCPSQHLKWLEQNIPQEKEWMEQLEGWPKLQGILLWKLHISHHHDSWRKREGLDQELLLWERYVTIKSLQKLLIRRAPFQWVIYEIMWGIRNDLRIQAAAVWGLQEAAEAYLVGSYIYIYTEGGVHGWNTLSKH